MPVVNLIDACYAELEKLKAEFKNQKAKAGQPIKTTFSEVICALIKNYKHGENV